MTVTGELVASLVVPDTVSAGAAVISPSAGEVTFSAGGTVSTVKVVLFAAAVLPSLSDADTDTVCAPSPSAAAGV